MGSNPIHDSLLITYDLVYNGMSSIFVDTQQVYIRYKMVCIGTDTALFSFVHEHCWSLNHNAFLVYIALEYYKIISTGQDHSTIEVFSSGWRG